MDGLAMRFQAESHNVANVNTPGYKREEVSFEDSLAEAIAESQDTGAGPQNPFGDGATDPATLLQEWSPSVTTDSQPQRVDKNGVSMEQEMGDLARTVMSFETDTEWVASQYRDIKFVADAK
ncbi:MAG: flagellar basal body rod protein FlgB [Cyanobacteria bacterium REEB65]|nr:flagellar basal body rod protein FlgB [Cyanobacteria bacterium REEB65]